MVHGHIEPSQLSDELSVDELHANGRWYRFTWDVESGVFCRMARIELRGGKEMYGKTIDSPPPHWSVD